jgi:hypothetical protein
MRAVLHCGFRHVGYGHVGVCSIVQRSLLCVDLAWSHAKHFVVVKHGGSVGECMCSTAHHADVSVHLAWSHAKHFVVCLGCDLTDSMVLTLQRMASVQWFGSTRMSGVETQVCGHVQCVEGKVETFLQSWNIALLNHSLHTQCMVLYTAAAPCTICHGCCVWLVGVHLDQEVL